MSRASHPGMASPTIGSSQPCWFSGDGHLTAQEAAVGRLAAAGHSTREIAADLFISGVAVRTHLARVCAKLDLESPEALLRGDVGDALRPAAVQVYCPDRAGDDPMADDQVADDPPSLSPQAVEVARLAGQGWRERAIAAELFIGIATVRAHLARLQAGSDGAGRIR